MFPYLQTLEKTNQIKRKNNNSARRNYLLKGPVMVNLLVCLGK